MHNHKTQKWITYGLQGSVTCSHQFSAEVIGLGYFRWCVPRGSIQILNAPLVILTQLQRIRVAVERTHHSIGLQGVLQAQDMAKLMSSHLEKISALTRIKGQ